MTDKETGLTWDNLHEQPEMRRLFQLALRVAIGSQGAPRRCRRQSCRAGGQCHMILGFDGGGHCGARFDFDRAVREAALMIAFLHHFGRINMQGEPWSPYSSDSRFGDPLKHKKDKKPKAPTPASGGQSDEARVGVAQGKPYGRDIEWEHRPAGTATGDTPVDGSLPRLRSFP